MLTIIFEWENWVFDLTEETLMTSDAFAVRFGDKINFGIPNVTQRQLVTSLIRMKWLAPYVRAMTGS